MRGGNRPQTGLPDRAILYRGPPQGAAVFVLALVGGAWGLISYRVLWGYTSLMVTRRFVNSLLGLVSFLPVRLVLFSIHFVEGRVVHHPFNFVANNEWIGFIAAGVGALLVVVPVVFMQWIVRTVRKGR